MLPGLSWAEIQFIIIIIYLFFPFLQPYLRHFFSKALNKFNSLSAGMK